MIFAALLFWCVVSVGYGEPADKTKDAKVRRFGSVIGVKEKTLARYKELHAAVWPGVLKAIKTANIENYSIYLRKLPDGKHYLFGYFEYAGDDLDADMKTLKDDPIVQKWWKETDPLQTPFADRGEGNWWAGMEEVFHFDGPAYDKAKAKRFGSVIGVKEETLKRYVELHADVWPGVLKMLEKCNIRNYSIYLRKLPDGKRYLFSYFEYAGDDLDADMKTLKDDPIVQKWWKETDPLQIPFKDRGEGNWWVSMEEVFYQK